MKKTKNLNISIPAPCHENWNEMTPEAKGRHCASCSKIVTDYTKMSDQELMKHLSVHGLGCGRFRKDQIYRPIPFPVPQRIWSFPRHIRQSMVAIFTAIAGSLTSIEIKAQERSSAVETVVGDTIYSTHPEFRTISGLVHSDGMPLANVGVFLPAYSMEKHFTDADGRFHFELPWDVDIDRLQLLVEKHNFKSQAYPLSKGTVELDFNLVPFECRPVPEPEIMGIMEIEMGEPMLIEHEETVIEPGSERVYDNKKQ